MTMHNDCQDVIFHEYLMARLFVYTLLAQTQAVRFTLYFDSVFSSDEPCLQQIRELDNLRYCF